MTEVLKTIFKSDTFGPIVQLFNIWHILIMLVVFGGSLLLAYLLRNKSEASKKKILDILVIVLIGLYFGDFLVHPFMTGHDALIVDKLPFHLCTSACILIALTRIFPNTFKSFKGAFVILGMIGGLMYLTVPTALADEYLICYKSLQTIIYHGLVFLIGVLSLSFGEVTPSFKTIYREAIVIAIMDIVSIGANHAYGGIKGEGQTYDWFFSTGKSFGVNEYLMPFVMFFILMGMVASIYGIYFLVRYLINKKQNKSSQKN